MSLAAGVPQAVVVVVTANAVQADGSNPGSVDTSTGLVLEPIQNASGPGAAVIPSIDPSNNRRVIMTPGVLSIGAPSSPWSFRIKAPGRTTFVTMTGTTAPPLDVSGVAWDGNPVGPA